MTVAVSWSHDLELACSDPTAGDDFTVTCVTNPNMSFKLDSSTLSMSGARKLKDHHNHVICNMKHKVGLAAWRAAPASLGVTLISESGECH